MLSTVYTIMYTISYPRLSVNGLAIMSNSRGDMVCLLRFFSIISILGVGNLLLALHGDDVLGLPLLDCDVFLQVPHGLDLFLFLLHPVLHW